MTEYHDRVRETSDTLGTAPFVLNGADEGYQSFADAYGGPVSGVRYAAFLGADWETGIGSLTLGPDTISRTTILESSNGGAIVNFPAGTKTIILSLPAADADSIGLIEVSGDAGATSDPARVLIIGSGLSLSIVGDEATVEVPTSGTGPSGGTLISGYEILVEADDVGGAVNGAALGTWPDQSANGYDFTEATNPPTYRSADSADGLPYVEFDGSNDVLQAIRTAGLVAQTDMTMYFVMRTRAHASQATLAAFSENGENTSTGIRPLWQVSTVGYPILTYNALSYSFATTNDFRRSTDWQVLAMRLDDRMSRGTITTIHGGLVRIDDLGATPSLPTLDFDRIRLGAVYSNFGALSQFARVDVRAFALYLAAHTDVQMRSMLGYLRDKWSADLLKHQP